MADILVVDDDPSIARAFERFLRYDRHEFRIASGAEAGLRLLADRVPNLIFMDVRMPGLGGLQALPMMREKYPSADVVIMTAHGNSQTSIDAMRAGAFDVLAKPLDVDELRAIIAKVTAAQAVKARMASAAADETETPALVGTSAAMNEVFKLIGRVATFDIPALVVGERGTGKRAVVAAIHANSARNAQPLTVIDAAAPDASAEVQALVDDRLEGTVHIAGVEALPVREQLRLSSALRARGTPAARVIASTEADLASLVERGEFNRDLYDTLAVIAIHLPPLRDRRDDIPLLVDALLRRLSVETGRGVRGVDAQAAKLLREHSWPGNIAELNNVLKRVSVLSTTGVIAADDIADSLQRSRGAVRRSGDSGLARAAKEALRERLNAPAGPDASAYHDVVSLVEEALVQEALDITDGNQVRAADLLGVNRTTLRKKAAGLD